MLMGLFYFVLRWGFLFFLSDKLLVLYCRQWHVQLISVYPTNSNSFEATIDLCLNAMSTWLDKGPIYD